MATILHIDHDDVAQKFIKATLGHQYNVVSAADGPTAIQYCAMIQPDVILLDLDLPDMDSRELTRRLKMFMPQTPIIHTAGQETAVAELVGNSGGFLAKPFADEELWRRIKSVLPGAAVIPPFVVSPGSDDAAIEQFEAQIDALNQANKRLASLNAISALIGTSLDLEHLTDEILLQIHKTIDFDSATLFLLKGNVLEAAASRGLSAYRKGMNVYTKSDKNSAWRVVQNKLPLIINDVTKSDYWEARPELSQVRSWLGVPLIFKDRVVGVLTLDKNEPDAFIEADARYFFTLAYQMAIAVENAQLFEEWEEQATRLKLINEVFQEITTILNVDHLYEALAWAIFQRLQYNRVAIFDVHLSSPVLRSYYDKSSPPPQLAESLMGFNLEVIRQVIKTARPALVNVPSNPKFLELAAGQPLAELGVPILIDNRVENVISVSARGLGDHDLWTLSSMARQASAVIENARLYENIDTYSEMLEQTVVARTQRLQAIKKISHVASRGADIDDLLTPIGREISQIFKPDEFAEHKILVFVGLLTGSKLGVRLIYKTPQHTPVDKSPDKPETIYKFEPTTWAGQVMRQAKPIIKNNIPIQHIYSNDNNPLTIVNSVILAPLIAAGKTIGLITVERQCADAFDESDLETLESVAFQIATAIEHARLLRKTREMAIVDERTRLARDMHDGVAQNLAYLLIQVDRCLNLVEEDSRLEAQLEQIGALLKQNIDELRRNIFDLRPVDLEGKSLFTVLENFVAEFGRRWNLQTSCTIQDKTPEVSPEVESSLYRILQEALSNARKHAQCSRLDVVLTTKKNETITLEIKDDGQGFDMTHASEYFQRGQSKGMGLISMRERTEYVGGKLTIDSQRGHGTRIVAELPLLGEAPGNG
jgi:signal transduction histidine kinase/DNA-binding NarL/FixJ family response regulator